MKPDLTKKAIAANIEALGAIIDDARLNLSQARAAIDDGEQNQAIGALLDIDRKLEDALALYRAAIALHRAGRTP
jgi:glycerol-3-phosphate dehydrogenase